MDVCGNKSLMDMYNFKFGMYFEKCRIESFIKWPKCWINTRELAANGFFYYDKFDTVECAFCDLKYCGFEADCIISEIHHRTKTICPFAEKRITENITLAETPNTPVFFGMLQLDEAYFESWFENPEDTMGYLFNDFDLWYRKYFLGPNPPKIPYPIEDAKVKRDIEMKFYKSSNKLHELKEKLWNLNFSMRESDLSNNTFNTEEMFKRWYTQRFIKSKPPRVRREEWVIHGPLLARRAKDRNEDSIWNAMYEISVVKSNSEFKDAKSEGALEALKRFDIWYKKLMSSDTSLDSALREVNNHKSSLLDICT